MKRTLTLFLLAAGLTSGGAIAQTAPVGGSDAKGNAPIKRAHTVNDGSAKPAANSFTQGQAMRHIEHSGYTGVSGLTKGKDGVWRGTAMKNGAPVNVAMDFKGNVTQGMAESAASAPMAASKAPSRSAGSMPMPSPAEASPATAAATPMRHRHHWRHRHHHRANMGCNTNPGPNGVACSGRDRNRNGISDKEDRAIGSH